MVENNPPDPNCELYSPCWCGTNLDHPRCNSVAMQNEAYLFAGLAILFVLILILKKVTK